MELIKQTGPHCLATSAAMALGVTSNIIHQFIGHDGTEIWWPPRSMRGVHMQEIQEYAMSIGKMFAPYEINPAIAPDMETEAREIGRTKSAFLAGIKHHRGIIITPTHAIAFLGLQGYDPNGFYRSVMMYDVLEAWILTSLI